MANAKILQAAVQLGNAAKTRAAARSEEDRFDDLYFAERHLANLAHHIGHEDWESALSAIQCLNRHVRNLDNLENDLLAFVPHVNSI